MKPCCPYPFNASVRRVCEQRDMQRLIERLKSEKSDLQRELRVKDSEASGAKQRAADAEESKLALETREREMRSRVDRLQRELRDARAGQGDVKNVLQSKDDTIGMR